MTSIPHASGHRWRHVPPAPKSVRVVATQRDQPQQELDLETAALVGTTPQHARLAPKLLVWSGLLAAIVLAAIALGWFLGGNHLGD
jgi:hypothetical protein